MRESRKPMACSCGGLIEIVTYTEGGQFFISHGVCKRCLKNIVLPQIPLKDWQ